MSQTLHFLYQEFIYIDSNRTQNLELLNDVVQDLILAELTKYNGSHKKGNKQKIISSFESINDLENYIVNLNQLFSKFLEANQSHNFGSINFVYSGSKLDKIALQEIKEASNTSLIANEIYSKECLALSKFEESGISNTRHYFSYSETSQDVATAQTSASTSKYRAIAPKLFLTIILIVIVMQLVKFGGSYIGDSYNELKYSKLEEALSKGDSFSLFQNSLKFKESELDHKFGYYVDQLIKVSVKVDSNDEETDFRVLKERVLSLEAKFKSYPTVRIYSNLIGLYDKSLEGRLSFHEINSLLAKSESEDQSLIILSLSIDYDVEKFQLIQQVLVLPFEDEVRDYLLTNLFQASLADNIDGRYAYYKKLVTEVSEPDLGDLLQRNLSTSHTNVRRNSYRLIVSLGTLEDYQLSQFVQYELSNSKDLDVFAKLISTIHMKTAQQDIIHHLEKIYKKAKRSKLSSKILANIQVCIKTVNK